MTEDEVKCWLRMHLDVSRETMERLDIFVQYLIREAQSQNLISASTFEHIWPRHILDSAQLLALLPDDHDDGPWLDLGSGAGFPGLVAAIIGKRRVTLVESRTRRIEYLNRAVKLLDLEDRVIIAGMPVERLKSAKYSVISARAFAPLPKLLQLATCFSTKNTYWLLPKGRNAAKELEDAKARWLLDLHIAPSITDAEAGIIVGYVPENIPVTP